MREVSGGYVFGGFFCGFAVAMGVVALANPYNRGIELGCLMGSDGQREIVWIDNARKCMPRDQAKELRK